MPIIVDCPECNGRFKVRDELAGRRVKCPKCGDTVTVPDEEEPAVAAGPPRRSRPRAADDDYEDDRPRRRRPRDDDDDDDYDRPRTKSKKGLIIGLCVGGGVLLAGGVVLILLLLLKGGGSERDLIIGEWEGIEGPDAGQRIEFTKDGKLISGVFGGKKTVNYRMLSATELEVEIPAERRQSIKRLREKAGKSGPDDTFTVKVEITKESLVVHAPDFVVNEREKAPKKYKRVGSPAPGPGGGERDPRLENDLRQIGIAYHNYCDTFRKGPAKAEDLLPFMEKKDVRLLNLLKNDLVFIYHVNIPDMIDGTSNTILAYQKDAPTRGGYVLFGDADVRRLSAEEFRTKPLARPRKK
jgi:predicted Zn finger-like uncharacterized protein